MKHKVDILNLEWETNSRDSNIVDPVLVSLEDRYGYTVKRASIWHFLSKILWYRPRILLMANDIGSTLNVDAFYFADKLGIQTISLISEGLAINSKNKETQKELDIDLFWGNNKKHVRVWDLKLLWSDLRKNNILKSVCGAEQFNLKVSGGTGFDRYHLLKYDENEWLGENSLSSFTFKKIILIIGYGFDKLPLLNSDEKLGRDKEQLDWLYSQRIIVHDIYEKIVANNPDIFYIFKQHPGVIHSYDTELAGLGDKYKNAVELQKGVDIASLISRADIVVAFDSTVCMEAWLRGNKPTILVNPQGIGFQRSGLYEGSIIVKTDMELQQLIDEFYTTGKVQSFEEKKEKRNEWIKKLIQFGDGANYLRASKLINDYLLEHTSKSASMTGAVWIKVFLRLLRELAEVLVEKTFLGYIRKETKSHYLKRSSLYNEKLRQVSVSKYREGIKEFENNHKKLVEDIIYNYIG